MKKSVINKINFHIKEKTPFLLITSFDTNNNIFIPDPSNSKVLFKFNNNKNYKTKKTSEKITYIPPKYENYLGKFNKVMEQIETGNSYLLNLTFPVKLTNQINLKNLFLSAKAKYKILVPEKFTFFSPETFFTIKDNIISTYPMKGTTKGVESELLTNTKEVDEQATIVDLLRNDLSIVANNVCLKDFRYTEKIQSSDGNEFFQTSSKISGEIKEEYINNIGELIFKLVPAGSISGAPKHKTVQIIKKIEDYERGFYTGVSFFFDGKDIDACVNIRFIEKIEDIYCFKTGGGITSQSKPKDEFQELLDKIYLPQ